MADGATTSFIVLGGGFRGLVAAYLLAKDGHRVTLLERGNRLGGVLAGADWDGMPLDLGCHLFDNTDAASTAFFFEMAGGADRFHAVETRYANLYQGRLARGMAVPDLSGQDDARIAAHLFDLLGAAAAPDPAPRDARTALAARYGGSLAAELAPMLAKMYATLPDALAPETLDASVFQRVRCVDDGRGAVLKQIPDLDARLAVSSAAAPAQFYPAAQPDLARNFYPKAGGMKGFVDHVIARLTDLGVTLCVGTGPIAISGADIRAEDGTTWTADRIVVTTAPAEAERAILGTNTLTDATHAVPMVLFYFRVSPDMFTGLHYTHLFDPAQAAFRISAPGLYGRIRSENGHSYICAECPCRQDSAIWTDPDGAADQIWGEARAAGIVAQTARYTDVKLLKTPVSYSAPKAGFARAHAKVRAAIAHDHSRVIDLSTLGFSKLSILSDVKAALGWT
ncbi:MAG: NAD(P)-binding protein [Pseudomonadota bacterium]